VSLNLAHPVVQTGRRTERNQPTTFAQENMIVHKL